MICHLYVHSACVFTIIVFVTSASCTFVESLMTTRTNFRLKGHVMERQRITSQFSCAQLCLRKEGCMSFNYKLSSNKGLCELSSSTARHFDQGLTERAGWMYGQIVRSGKKSVKQSAKPGKDAGITQRLNSSGSVCCPGLQIYTAF